MKDLSFENPKAPNSLRQLSGEKAPKFQIDANVSSRALTDHGKDIFEVELSIKSVTKLEFSGEKGARQVSKVAESKITADYLKKLIEDS